MQRDDTKRSQVFQSPDPLFSTSPRVPLKTKNRFILFTVVMLIAAGLFLYLSDSLNHSIRIRVSEDPSRYLLEARYHRQDYAKVAQYIDSCLQKEAIFHGAQRVDALLILDDHTRFRILAMPGRLKIELFRNDNPVQSYQRVKAMCQGIVKIIKK